MQHDLVVRGGLIVDGSGGAPFIGDIAISGGLIAAIGRVEGKGATEIDAAGRITGHVNTIIANCHFRTARMGLLRLGNGASLCPIRVKGLPWRSTGSATTPL